MTIASLDRTLGLFWIDLARHLWQSALVLIPLFVLARVLRSAPARWSHRLWVAALAKLFVPLALFGPMVGAAAQWLLAGHALSGPANDSSGFRVLVTAIGADPIASMGRAVDRLPAPFFIVCTLAYAIVAVWLVIRTGRDIITARALAHAALKVEGDRRARLESAMRLAGVPEDRVVVSSSNSIPAVVGAIRPQIVLPARLLDELDVDELRAVLLHEDMHRRHGDAAIAVAQRVASSLFFFFPLLAPIQRRLRDAAELRCDEDALRAGAEPQAYVRALARTIRMGLDPSPAPAALGDGNRSLVARRLEKLREPLTTKTTSWHRVAIGLAVAVLAAGIFLPVAPARIVTGPEPVLPELDRLWNKDRFVSAQFENTPASKVLEAIATEGKVRIDTVGPEDCCLVSVSLKDTSLRRALEVIAAQTGVQYEVVDPNTLRARLPVALVPTADMTMPRVVHKVEPLYPKDARQARAGGIVILQAVIKEDGTVRDVEVLRHADGWPSLDEAAIAAVRQWTYTAPIKDGHPVSVYYTVKVEFRLE